MYAISRLAPNITLNFVISRQNQNAIQSIYSIWSTECRYLLYEIIPLSQKDHSRLCRSSTITGIHDGIIVSVADNDGTTALPVFSIEVTMDEVELAIATGDASVVSDRKNLEQALIDTIDRDASAYDDVFIELFNLEVVIDIAGSMNIGVIAEGVETQEQSRMLIDLGCWIHQGYLYSKPVDAEQFALLMKNDRYNTAA